MGIMAVQTFLARFDRSVLDRRLGHRCRHVIVAPQTELLDFFDQQGRFEGLMRIVAGGAPIEGRRVRERLGQLFGEIVVTFEAALVDGQEQATGIGGVRVFVARAAVRLVHLIGHVLHKVLGPLRIRPAADSRAGRRILAESDCDDG